MITIYLFLRKKCSLSDLVPPILQLAEKRNRAFSELRALTSSRVSRYKRCQWLILWRVIQFQPKIRMHPYGMGSLQTAFLTRNKFFDKFFWLHLQLMYPQNVTGACCTNKIFLIAPLAGLIYSLYTPLSEWWRPPWLRSIVAYAYQRLLPLLKIVPAYSWRSRSGCVLDQNVVTFWPGAVPRKVGPHCVFCDVVSLSTFLEMAPGIDCKSAR